MKKMTAGISATLACSAILMLLPSCTGGMKHIRNEKAGKLTATYQLVADEEKNIYLDDETAPGPPYIQMINDSILTFLNPRNNSIYFYDYGNGTFMRKITYEKEGPNAVYYPTGYYIKNMDSIYIYLKSQVSVALTDSSGKVRESISLKNDDPYWPLYLPQYLLNTAVPLIETHGRLILTGLSPFSIPDTLIGKFRFSACIDMKTREVKFVHTYPEAIYGNNSNWEGGVSTMVYPALSPAGELIYSFSASHDLHLAKGDAETYETVYAGSNVAGTIHSVDWDNPRQTPDKLLFAYFAGEDIYTSILHDPWRNLYYRFMLQGISGATSDTRKEDKPIIVIVMDGQFNYQGETVIGTWRQWRWENSFVTAGGLNIEYIDADDENEDYLHFRIFKIKEL
jgi:hypothetical protein